MGLPHLKGLRLALAGLLVGAAFVAIACGDDEDSGEGDGAALSVVASTTIVEDLVKQVGGDRVSVESIVPGGADPHTFVLAPSDIRKATEADLVVIVGGGLSAFEEDLEDSAQGTVLELTHDMALRPFPEGLAHAEDDHDEEGEHHDEDEGEDHDEDEGEDHDEDEGEDHDEDEGEDHDEDEGEDHDEDEGDDHGDEEGDDHGDEEGDDHGDEEGDDHGDEEGDDHGDEEGDDHGDEEGDDHGDEEGDDHGDEEGDDHGDDEGDDHGDDEGDDHGDEGGHEHGAFDPHFWMDIDFTIQAVEEIRDELTRLDPDGADGYRERAAAYIAELREVDTEIREQLAGLPEERRYLVTFHDAYGYFADRYGLTILGFLVEGPEEEPSASAISELVESITELGIPYIFTEPQFSARVIEQIARDTGTTVRTIPSGGLAEEYPTYVEFLRAIAGGIAE